jgi:hypothetical protein
VGRTLWLSDSLRHSYGSVGTPAHVRTLPNIGCVAFLSILEGTGEYVDDSVITTKVKTAIFNEPGLEVSEIKVETYTGIVQLSGFVSSGADIKGAVRVASAVGGVKSVTNDIQLK